jgi:hypothetical protein
VFEEGVSTSQRRAATKPDEFPSARPEGFRGEVSGVCHPRGFSAPFGRQKEQSLFQNTNRLFSRYPMLRQLDRIEQHNLQPLFLGVIDRVLRAARAAAVHGDQRAGAVHHVFVAALVAALRVPGEEDHGPVGLAERVEVPFLVVLRPAGVLTFACGAIAPSAFAFGADAPQRFYLSYQIYSAAPSASLCDAQLCSRSRLCRNYAKLGGIPAAHVAGRLLSFLFVLIDNKHCDAPAGGIY